MVPVNSSGRTMHGEIDFRCSGRGGGGGSHAQIGSTQNLGIMLAPASM